MKPTFKSSELIYRTNPNPKAVYFTGHLVKHWCLSLKRCILRCSWFDYLNVQRQYQLPRALNNLPN